MHGQEARRPRGVGVRGTWDRGFRPGVGQGTRRRGGRRAALQIRPAVAKGDQTGAVMAGGGVGFRGGVNGRSGGVGGRCLRRRQRAAEDVAAAGGQWLGGARGQCLRPLRRQSVQRARSPRRGRRHVAAGLPPAASDRVPPARPGAEPRPRRAARHLRTRFVAGWSPHRLCDAHRCPTSAGKRGEIRIQDDPPP
jgi:hypothetical protein